MQSIAHHALLAQLKHVVSLLFAKGRPIFPQSNSLDSGHRVTVESDVATTAGSWITELMELCLRKCTAATLEDRPHTRPGEMAASELHDIAYDEGLLPAAQLLVCLLDKEAHVDSQHGFRVSLAQAALPFAARALSLTTSSTASPTTLESFRLLTQRTLLPLILSYIPPLAKTRVGCLWLAAHFEIYTDL